MLIMLVSLLITTLIKQKPLSLVMCVCVWITQAFLLLYIIMSRNFQVEGAKYRLSTWDEKSEPLLQK
jgi:hypothetical protein